MNYRNFVAALVVIVCTAATPALADLETSGVWPTAGPQGNRVSVTSASPFTLYDVADAPAQEAHVTFTPAVGASADNPAPAVILLHGAGGVSSSREGRYAREFAAQGVAVAVIDVFRAR
ncbi:MAG: hypothetical protein AAFW98_09670, partial [Pseudomonadota bacterium]